jgi:hypothetical protein
LNSEKILKERMSKEQKPKTKGGSLTNLQKECVRNLTLEQLLSLIDHETGQIRDYGFHPETNDLIYERIRQLTRPTQAPRQTTRKRMN